MRFNCGVTTLYCSGRDQGAWLARTRPSPRSQQLFRRGLASLETLCGPGNKFKVAPLRLLQQAGQGVDRCRGRPSRCGLGHPGPGPACLCTPGAAGAVAAPQGRADRGGRSGVERSPHPAAAGGRRRAAAARPARPRRRQGRFGAGGPESARFKVPVMQQRMSHRCFAIAGCRRCCCCRDGPALVMHRCLAGETCACLGGAQAGQRRQPGLAAGAAALPGELAGCGRATGVGGCWSVRVGGWGGHGGQLASAAVPPHTANVASVCCF